MAEISVQNRSLEDLHFFVGNSQQLSVGKLTSCCIYIWYCIYWFCVTSLYLPLANKGAHLYLSAVRTVNVSWR